MTVKRILPALLALLICCTASACSQPAPAAPASPSSVPEAPVASLPESPASQPEEAQSGQEDAVTDHLYVADAARYRGTVASIDTDINGEAMYRLTAFPGSGLTEQLLVAFTDDSRTSFDLSSVKEGDHLEVFYHPGVEGACALTNYDVIAANKLLPAEAVYYNGILVEQRSREDGSVDLVMVPQDTPPESRQDPMYQFIFHTGPDTQLRMAQEELLEGVQLNIYHKGIATRSIPPQGVALEVRAIEVS